MYGKLGFWTSKARLKNLKLWDRNWKQELVLRVVFPLIKWDPLKADYFRLKTLYDTYLNSQQKLPIQGSKLSILVVQLFHSVLFPPEVLDIFYRCFQNGSLVLAGITAGKGITKVQQRASPSTSSVPIYSTMGFMINNINAKPRRVFSFRYVHVQAYRQEDMCAKGVNATQMG